MKSTQLAAVVLGVLMGGLAVGATAVRPSPSIEGVWGFVSETNTETGQILHTDKDLEAMWVFTKTHYCLARMERGRLFKSAADLAQMPADARVRYYEQLLRYASTAGTYEVSGHWLKRTWDISLGPDILGQKQTAHFSVDGHTLTVDLPRRDAASGPASRVVYRRIE